MRAGIRLRGQQIDVKSGRVQSLAAFSVYGTVGTAARNVSRIHAGSEAAHVDWRSDYGSLTYSTTDVPDDIAAGMRLLMDRLHLSYGAADFIVDPGGRWWFLEVNPCGQWDWIQGATGLPIAAAIADELQGVA
ncbi:hypothetical protein ACFYW1_31435 [Streptomyces sp. NPDC002669]|uniref:hypothetical protein n=2 Tax=unclassified Streptomyces TaxID=2593676 RepID=UPI0036A3CB7E